MSPDVKPLNTGQKEAFEKIWKFVEQPGADTFLLKGYAGTGKTFLMQQLAAWLKKKEKKFSLLAATGRAATVLRGKTGFDATTVHSELYHFNKVDGDDELIQNDAPIEMFGQMTLQFDLRATDEGDKLYIVDEASMLSSIHNYTPFATFGSGVLLEDFFQAVNRNKVIFVGDPCQLPPIGQRVSPALDATWLAGQNRTTESFTLDKIERTDTDILTLAQSIRTLSELENWPLYPKLPARSISHVRLSTTTDELFKQYVAHYKTTGPEGTVAVARSNRMVHQLNEAFREERYGRPRMPLQQGDILLVTQNNYKVPLTNGDFVEVRSLGEERRHVNLRFQSVRVKAILSEKEYEILLSLDILHSHAVNFSTDQMKAIMVDFSRRARAKGIVPNSEEYREAMKTDSYVNCLRATYGYAVTCHKAQGGEWDDLFLFLDKGMYAMHRSDLTRWWYTAVTRARKYLHLSDDWWIC